MSFSYGRGFEMPTHDTSRLEGRLALVSVMLTAVAITVNHWYSLGSSAFVLGALLLVVPAALWWAYKRTGRRVAFAAYLVMNAWIIASGSEAVRTASYGNRNSPNSVL